MRACIYEEYGPAGVVKLKEVQTPRPAPDSVLVRVHSAAVTTADWRFRASVFPRIFWLPGRLMVGLFRPRNPILGMDFSGVVEQVGAQVTRFRVGDSVFGSSSVGRRGAHAEYLVVRETDAVIHKPDSLSHHEAAAVPFGANAALAFLRDVARVRPGQRVLVLGGSGSVGSWAVQLAKHFGAHVTAVCSARNLELVRSLGADRALDYAREPILEIGGEYDLIFDAFGATSFAACRGALADGGVFLPLETGVREMLQLLTTSFGARRRIKLGVSKNSCESLQFIAQLLESGQVRALVDQVYPMEQVVDAHRHVEGRHKRGSVVLALAATT
ncbi:MAG: NAD(P)-dependent alcohol dehydrogenase [Polyangiaceae bacterium]